jgi:alpha-galactosidase
MFLHLDYYVTESSGHNSEYNAWFRKRPDLIETYCLHGTNWNPGEYAYIVKRYEERETKWRDEAREWLAKDDAISLARGEEYAAYIINALAGDGDLFEFNGNVSNDGLIDGLPDGCCVEVPVTASKAGLRAMRVGKLPPQCQALVSISAQNEEMAVEGALSGDPRPVFHSICYDPLTSAVLSLEEIKAMTNELFAANRDYLPQFTSFSV